MIRATMGADVTDSNLKKWYPARYLVIVISFLAGTMVASGATAESTPDRSTLVRLNRVAEAIRYFTSDIGRLPTDAEGLSVLASNPGLDGWNGPYLAIHETVDDWGRDFVYLVPGSHGEGDYDLYSMGYNGRDDSGEKDDITTWSGINRSCYPTSGFKLLLKRLGLPPC